MPEEQTRKCPQCGKDVIPKIKYSDVKDPSRAGEGKEEKTMRIESYFVCPLCDARLS
jgi:rubredoxin